MKTLWQKETLLINHDEQFLLLPQGFISIQLFNFYLKRSSKCCGHWDEILNWYQNPILWAPRSNLNPFPHIDIFWRLCSGQIFENIVTKKEIAQNEQFLLLTQCCPLLVIGYPFKYRDFLFFDKICSKSSAAELSYEGKG